MAIKRPHADCPIAQSSGQRQLASPAGRYDEAWEALGRVVVMVGLVGTGCTGQMVGGPDSASMSLDERSGTHVSGAAALGGYDVRFEARSWGLEAAQVTYDFGEVVVEYGVSVGDDEFWFDGHGAALEPGHVALMRALAPLLDAELGDDPDGRGVAEDMLLSTAVHLSMGTVDHALARETAPVLPVLDGEDVLYSNADDGIRCVRKDDPYYAEWGWPGHQFAGTTRTGSSCGGNGFCGDCKFSTAEQWTQDCLEHDACLDDAHERGLWALDANPYDYWCGDEFREAADDFSLGWLIRCRGR